RRTLMAGRTIEMRSTQPAPPPLNHLKHARTDPHERRHAQNHKPHWESDDGTDHQAKHRAHKRAETNAPSEREHRPLEPRRRLPVSSTSNRDRLALSRRDPQPEVPNQRTAEIDLKRRLRRRHNALITP